MTDTTGQAKSFEELEFTDDFMFCKILQNNPELCRELLTMILGKKIQLLKSQEKQKAIEITSDGKGVRLDVYVEDGEDNVYDIEMQTTNSRNLPKRTRYYQGMIDLNLIERGAKYEELKKSYIIFICTFDYFKKNRHKYSFSHICEEFPELRLQDDAKSIFLCAGAGADDVSEDMKDFLDYLVTRKPKSKFTKLLDHAVADARKHEKWRQEFMTLYMRDQENQEIGRKTLLTEQVNKKLSKGFTIPEIAEMLEEDEATIRQLIEQMQ